MNEVVNSIENIYNAFRHVPRPLEIQGCPCGTCLTTEDLSKILLYNLREIPFDAIDGYAEGVFGTFGEKESFKYLLPRLLELKYLDNKHYPLEYLHDKIKQSEWLTWPKPLIYSLKSLFKTLIINLKNNPHLLTGIYCFLFELAVSHDDVKEYIKLLPSNKKQDDFLVEYLNLKDALHDEYEYTQIQPSENSTKQIAEWLENYLKG